LKLGGIGSASSRRNLIHVLLDTLCLEKAH
jgi:hypothetical protein